LEEAIGKAVELHPALARQANITKASITSFANEVETENAARAARQEASKKFVKLVHERMDKTGEDYDRAWRSCQFIHKPEYANTLPPASVEVVNASSGADRAARMDRIKDGVGNLMRLRKLNYNEAYTTFAKENPDLKPFMLNSGSGSSDGRISNTGDATYGPHDRPEAQGIGPAWRPSPGHSTDPDAYKQNLNQVPFSEMERLGLPVDATADEWQAAKSAGTEDFVKIWKVMVKFVARTKNYDDYVAQIYALGRYGKLARAAKDSLAQPIEHNIGDNLYK
jgi:hypothetical protein